MISKFDNILLGIAVAFIVATIGFGLVAQGVDTANALFDVTLRFRERSLALIGICLNIIPMNYFRKKYWNKSLRGLVIGTFLLAVIWFIRYGQTLLDGSAGSVN